MATAQPHFHPEIRRSTDADLAAILTWLKQQDRQGVHGTFWCNRGLTVEAHEGGELLVYIDQSTQQPVAYQWGGLITPGILEVRDDMRGHGIGKALVEHSLALAAEAGNDLLLIQCKPSSSIPFWQRMGFTLLSDKPTYEQENYAYRVMPRKRGPWEGVPTAQVTVEWFPETRNWDKTTAPAATQAIEGAWLDEELELTERASFFDRLVERDVVVRVVVDGQEWYCDKARNEDAAALGVEPCNNGFRIDTLYRPRRRLSPHPSQRGA